MRRQYKGSMTVEAAVVVSMVIFILPAMIYLCYFLHDRAILQSYSLRQAESTVWEKELRGKPPVFMIGFRVEKTDGKWLTPKGSGLVAGRQWQMEKEMCAVRVNYAQDRLVAVILKKGKK